MKNIILAIVLSTAYVAIGQASQETKEIKSQVDADVEMFFGAIARDLGELNDIITCMSELGKEENPVLTFASRFSIEKYWPLHMNCIAERFKDIRGEDGERFEARLKAIQEKVEDYKERYQKAMGPIKHLFVEDSKRVEPTGNEKPQEDDWHVVTDKDLADSD